MILLGLQDYTPGFIVLISGYGGSTLVTLIWVKQVLTLTLTPAPTPTLTLNPNPPPNPYHQPSP